MDSSGVVEEGRGRAAAYWAALDIELAYPSVRLDRLEEAILSAVRKPVLSLRVDGCPEAVLDALQDEDLRVAIGRRLAAALQQVRVRDSEIP